MSVQHPSFSNERTTFGSRGIEDFRTTQLQHPLISSNHLPLYSWFHFRERLNPKFRDLMKLWLRYEWTTQHCMFLPRVVLLFHFFFPMWHWLFLKFCYKLASFLNEINIFGKKNLHFSVEILFRKHLSSCRLLVLFKEYKINALMKTTLEYNITLWFLKSRTYFQKLTYKMTIIWYSLIFYFT